MPNWTRRGVSRHGQAGSIQYVLLIPITPRAGLVDSPSSVSAQGEPEPEEEEDDENGENWDSEEERFRRWADQGYDGGPWDASDDDDGPYGSDSWPR